MNDTRSKQVANVAAKGTEAWLAGLTRDDNPYIISTQSGLKWARIWLDGYNRATHGVQCDTCDKWLSVERGYRFEYHNGFNYFLCIHCEFQTEKVAVQ